MQKDHVSRRSFLMLHATSLYICYFLFAQQWVLHIRFLAKQPDDDNYRRAD